VYAADYKLIYNIIEKVENATCWKYAIWNQYNK